MQSKQTKTVVQIPTTSEKLEQLLALLNITTVYYVDDENNLGDFDIQIITGELEKIYSLEKEESLSQIQLEDWDRSLPKEGVIESIVNLWPQISFEVKKLIYSEILKFTNAEDLQLDFERAARVSMQLPIGITKIMSPQQWDEEKFKLQTIIKDGERILILFDEELKHAGIKYESIRGQDLIVQVKKLGLNDKIISTLLTYKTSTRDELLFRDRIIEHRKNASIDPLEINDFFPLAKERLDDAEVFADGIKKTLINNYFEIIKKHTIELIEYSYQEASKKIKQFDTYDFEETILRSSIKEGVWEPETIIRIADITFENELKKRMVETNYALKVNNEFKASQGFLEIQFNIPANLKPYSDKFILRHNEIYDDGSIINSLRKPLENGDIFQIGDIKYILVSQACDMMVRGKGNKMGTRNAKIATLLKINNQTFEQHKKKKKDNEHYLRDKYALPYFKIETDEIGVVEFTDYLIVDIDYLDFCVFNNEGDGSINVLHPNVNKGYLSLTWEKRFDLLMEKMLKHFGKISEINQYLKKDNKKNHTLIWKKKLLQIIQKLNLPKYKIRAAKINPPFSKNTNQGKLDEILQTFYPRLILASSNSVDDIVKFINDGTFKFSVKRVAKYKDIGAAYLLERYTKHLSRIAEPHDFALKA